MRADSPGRARLFRSIDRLGINRLAFDRTRKSLRILCYHGAWTVTRPHFGNKIFIGRDTFQQRLKALADHRCNVLPLLEALENLRSGTLPPRAVSITIDDGWASTFDFMLPELMKYQFPATIYLQTQRLISGAPIHEVAISFAIAATPSDSVTLPPELLRDLPAEGGMKETFQLRDPGERRRLSVFLNLLFDRSPQSARKNLLNALFNTMQIRADDLDRARIFNLGTPAEVRSAAASGFEIALHTHTHSLGDFSPEVMGDEIRSNQEALGEILGWSPEGFRHFCWPSGDYTEQALKDLATIGIEVATTCDHGLVSAGANPLRLPRILDGELTSAPEFLAMVSGAKYLVAKMRPF